MNGGLDLYEDSTQNFESELDKCLEDDCVSELSFSEETQSDDIILSKIRNISLQGRISASSSKFDIFKYIISTYKDDPVMVETMLAITAVPSNQVSVERIFSGMKYALSDARANLSGSLLNDILTCRYNAQLFDRINFDAY